MLSKNKIKYIRYLELKKYRKEEQVFIAEGHKLVGDLLGHFPCRLLLGTDKWLNEHPLIEAEETIEVSREELSRASLLKTPQEVLALFEIPHYEWDPKIAEHSLCLALDDVQDPGNLGTIIRIADWFGIHHIFCSNGCVDAFNPKTVQATMGALARVQLHYCDLPAFLQAQPKEVPVFGTFLDGENLYAQELSTNGIIIMGKKRNQSASGTIGKPETADPQLPARADHQRITQCSRCHSYRMRRIPQTILNGQKVQQDITRGLYGLQR